MQICICIYRKSQTFPSDDSHSSHLKRIQAEGALWRSRRGPDRWRAPQKQSLQWVGVLPRGAKLPAWLPQPHLSRVERWVQLRFSPPDSSAGLGITPLYLFPYVIIFHTLMQQEPRSSQNLQKSFQQKLIFNYHSNSPGLSAVKMESKDSWCMFDTECRHAGTKTGAEQSKQDEEWLKLNWGNSNRPESSLNQIIFTIWEEMQFVFIRLTPNSFRGRRQREGTGPGVLALTAEVWSDTSRLISSHQCETITPLL